MTGAPSWTRTNIVGLEGRLPVRRPGRLERASGVEPSRASLATMPRTMRARVIGSCRRICTCCLRLIRSVLICMSFAAIYWSEWLDSNQRSRSWSGRQDLHLRLPSSRLGCLLLTYALRLDTPTGVAPAWSRFAGDRLELLGHGVEFGVTGWTCTSYGGVTARGLSASPSATDWYPRQDLHPHDSRHYVLSVACLLIPPRGH